MKFLSSIICITTIICSSTSYSWGWNNYGHRVIAEITEQILQPETKNKIKKIFGEQFSLRENSNWAEEIAPQRRRTYKWHYVHVPQDRDEFIADRDCPQGQCLISAIENFTQILGQNTASLESREEALKFLIYLIGELHQPLRCGYREDQGGQGAKVIYARKKVSLLKVWDHYLLMKDQMPFETYVDKLTHRYNPKEIKKISQGTILDWYLESRTLLRNHVYTFPLNNVINFEYQDHAISIIDNQLLKAGIRLASLLDAIFADIPPH